MASSFFALLDDIATLLDDVALLTKVAAQKTAGVVGDDLALNAEQLSGIAAQRELPVVWAVAKGSLLNKAILVPLALALSVFVPWAITPLLLLGGAYLCLEGFEKLAHSRSQSGSHSQSKQEHAAVSPAGQALQEGRGEQSEADPRALEQLKVKGAVRTDFVLSAEIIVLTLGAVQGADWRTQLAVLAGVGVLMTVGVYGLVACIVKLDDLGFWLKRRAARGVGGARLQALLGQFLVRTAPVLMRVLTVVGTAAMFMVGGGIVLHALPFWHGAPWFVSFALELLVGVLLGGFVFAVVSWFERRKSAPH